MNVFHSWYTLGSIYSNQFKTQSDFYNHLQCVAKECNFSSHDEVVKFLFLNHNNNTQVREDLLKEMKEDTTLATMLNIAWISEGTIHSEELSKQYLETIKVSNKQIDSVKKSRSKCADPGIDLSLKAKGTLTIHMLPTNLMVVNRIRIKAKIGLIMISMKWTIRTILSLTMNKTQSLWCSTCSLGTRMWCLMKYLLNLHYSEHSLICMCQMDQMERHFVSKLTLAHVVTCYHIISTNR